MKFSYVPMSVLLAAALAVPLAAQGNPAATPGNAAAAKQSAGAASVAAPGDSDPLLDPDPLPKTPVSLVGGIVRKVDLIRGKLSLRIFGGGNLDVQFDSRSHIFRDGMETTQLAVRPGDRVYLDTQLDRTTSHTFARNIHIVTTAAEGSADGQVLDYNPDRGEMIVQDRISGQPVRVFVTKNTIVERKAQAGSAAMIRPGVLVAVRFAAGGGGTGTAQQVEVLAEPGGEFTFSGRVTFIDLRSGIVAIDNTTDGKNYTVHVSRQQVTPALVVGAQVTAKAQFNGRDYLAQSLVIDGGPQQSKNQPDAQ